MPRQTAIRIHVDVGPDHTVRLPAEVPVGPAELIVLMEERGVDGRTPESLLGLMSEEPELAEEMMRHISEARAAWHARPID